MQTMPHAWKHAISQAHRSNINHAEYETPKGVLSQNIRVKSVNMSWKETENILLHYPICQRTE